MKSIELCGLMQQKQLKYARFFSLLKFLPFRDFRVLMGFYAKTINGLGGGLKYVLLSARKLGKSVHLTSIFLEIGWFNHQLIFHFQFISSGTLLNSND